MKQLVTVLLFLFFAGLLTAQVPGYLGKRFFAKAEGLVMLSMGPTSHNKGILNTTGIGSNYGNGSSLGLDYRVGVSAGYAFSRLKGWAISANYLKTGMTADVRLANNDLPKAFYQLKGYTVGLGRLWFKRRSGAIAPFGNYFGLHLQTSFLRGTFDEEESGYKFLIENPLGFEPKATYVSLGLEFGQHNIKKDKFLINYAFQVNLPLLGFGKGLDILFNDYFLGYYEDYGQDNAESFKLSAQKRMITHDILGIKIGFGILR